MADSMTKKTICQLLLIVLLIQHNVGTGFLFTPPNGSLKKDKDYSLFYVGETLTLHCKKFQNFTGTVRFMQGNVGVSHRWVTQVNETYARMDKTVTSEDFPVTTYQCSDDSGLIDSIGGIFTEYRPQKATDLQMVWLNRETLSFSWRFGDTPFKNYHLVAVNNVTAEWSNNPDNDTSWQLCYHGNLTTNFCEPWPYTNQRNNVTVRVNFTSEKRNNLVTTVFPSLPVREHAKPNPVQRVEVVALNSTTAQLNITAEDSGTLNFSITYYATSGQNGSITKVTGLTTKRTFEIPKLHPHRTYGFEVRAKYQWGFLSELPDVNLTLLMPEAGTV